jgi:hypothetical protein
VLFITGRDAIYGDVNCSSSQKIKEIIIMMIMMMMMIAVRKEEREVSSESNLLRRSNLVDFWNLSRSWQKLSRDLPTHEYYEKFSFPNGFFHLCQLL